MELLEDALLRKFTRKVTTPDIARQHILRMSGNQAGRNVLNGAMAEALFLDRNPEWGYVGSPNSPQHDVYRWVAGRKTPFNGQIKFHSSGDPGVYAADMGSDYRAHRFFVPDDHVSSLKNYWRAEAVQLEARGDSTAAKEAWRQFARVRGTGFTSTEVRANVSSAANAVAREKNATYVSFGGSLALAIGPTIWDWAEGNVEANQALYRTTRALSLLGVGVGSDLVLTTMRQGTLRGTLRGNVIVGTAVTLVDTTWLLYEHGWSRAFQDPDFYESIGGGVGGLVSGMIGAGAATAWCPGPGWVVTGVAVIGGAVVGTVGYIGGRSATQKFLEVFAPKMLQKQQRQRLSEINHGIEQRIAELQPLTVH